MHAKLTFPFLLLNFLRGMGPADICNATTAMTTDNNVRKRKTLTITIMMMRRRRWKTRWIAEIDDEENLDYNSQKD